PVVTYLVEDGIGDTNESTLTIVVTPADNIPPVAEDDGFSIYQGESVSGNLITHVDGNDGIADHDGGDGAVLTITQVNGVDLVFGADGFATVNVDGGAVTINAAGDFTYNNSDGYILDSESPSFLYTLSDGTDTDTAKVTIDIDDTAPNPVDDTNYITYNDNEGLSVGKFISGNILKGGSSGDRGDSSPGETVILTKVEYGSQVYQFDDTTTSHIITTDFGKFTLNDAGVYYFFLDEGVDITTIPPSLEFDYTIRDDDKNEMGETKNPETGEATLTIYLTHVDVSAKAANTSSEDELIDLSFAAEASIVNANDENNKSSTNTDLSDLLTSDDNNLDDYLSFNELSNDEVADNFEGELGLDAEVESVVKESEAETIVTNSLLKEGATLISDASPENVPQQIELDSNDHI
ncbi:hypothetical protein, partial [Colwellia sp. 3_MG-2023]|uniref:Ig-like domain-containing protein n=3 Tax=Colwellia TaxID=28228 RepID=UPI0026E46853